jgi:hypothetical protein
MCTRTATRVGLSQWLGSGIAFRVDAHKCAGGFLPPINVDDDANVTVVHFIPFPSSSIPRLGNWRSGGNGSAGGGGSSPGGGYERRGWGCRIATTWTEGEGRL